MRKCPHCDTPIPQGKNQCPGCGRSYWEPGKDLAGEEESSPESRKEGCASLVIWPLLISIGVTAILILFGFSTRLFGRGNSITATFIWIILSILLGAVIFKWLFNK